MNLVDALYWINGAFKGALNWTPTANRTITLPDATGTVLLNTTVVPLAEPTTNTLRLGTGAAASNTTGYNWMAIGRNAGSSATSAYQWVAIGDSAGRFNTNARDWVAIGANAGYSSTTGLGWCAIGANAGYSNTIGDRWVALGPAAAYSSTTGSNWVAIGDSAGNANTIGSGWIAIGYNSATSSTTGSNFIAIGLGTLSNCTTGNSNIAIGNNTGIGITTGSGNTIIGANVTGLAAALTNNVILASGDGVIKFQIDSAGLATLTATPSTGDRSLKVATTAFVQNAVAIAGSVVNPVGVTTVDWSIPAGVRSITLLSKGVNGQTDPIVRLGSSGGVLATGYNNALVTTGVATGLNAGSTIGLQVPGYEDSTGSFCMNFYRISPNQWNSAGQSMYTVQYTRLSSGNIALPGELTTFRYISTVTMNSGFLQLLWEF